MNEQQRQELIDALLQTENIEQLLELVAQRTELLHPETLQQLLEYAQQLHAANPERAQALLKRIFALGALVTLAAQAAQAIQAGAGQTLQIEVPDHIPPSTDPSAAWTQPLRQHIASGFRNDEPLQVALQQAQQAGETALAYILSAWQQGEHEQAAAQAALLFQHLRQHGRQEEAYTLLLLPLTLQAVLTERFRQFPLERQMDALRAGLEACEAGVRLSRALSDAHCEALFWTFRGRGLYALRQYAEAEQCYREALGIYRPLAQQQPQVYEADVAMTLTNLGNALRESRRYAEAEQCYREALGIYRRLAQQQPEVYEPYVVATLNSLGNALYELRRYDEAVACYEEVLGIYRKLAQQQPQVYAPDVATTLTNLGTALYELRRYAEAEQCYREALDIYRPLAQLHPEVYEVDMAMPLSNLGSINLVMARYVEARTYYEEALAICRRQTLTQDNPFCLAAIARILFRQGLTDLHLSHLETALAAFEESLHIYQSLERALLNQSDERIFRILQEGQRALAAPSVTETTHLLQTLLQPFADELPELLLEPSR